MIPAFKNRASMFKVEKEDWSVPDWHCPYCGIGILEKEEIKTQESNQSKKSNKNPDWEPTWISGCALGTLKCNKKSCAELVSFVGDYSVTEDMSYDENGVPDGFSFSEKISPCYFYPPLCLIQVHENYPKSIKDELGSSFRLYWNEPESCANKIRICVEHLLTDLKIPRYTRTKKYLPLHHRINKLESKFSEEKTHLMALKIIGNPGSHGEKIHTLDLVNAYEILEHVLSGIYVREAKRIKKVSSGYLKKKK